MKNRFFLIIIPLFCGSLIQANANPFAPNIDIYFENSTKGRVFIKPYIWTEKARETLSKGFIFSDRIITVEPGKAVMYDWIGHLELNVFGGIFDKNVLRGARVEFEGNKHKPLDIWVDGNYRGQSLSNIRRVDVDAKFATGVPGENSLRGKPEQLVLIDEKGKWLAQGSVGREITLINEDGMVLTAKGVPYALTAPDVIFRVTD